VLRSDVVVVPREMEWRDDEGISSGSLVPNYLLRHTCLVAIAIMTWSKFVREAVAFNVELTWLLLLELCACCMLRLWMAMAMLNLGPPLVPGWAGLCKAVVSWLNMSVCSSSMQLVTNLRNHIPDPWLFDGPFGVVDGIAQLQNVAACLAEVGPQTQQRAGGYKCAIHSLRVCR
jgi:hypothetical protein